MHKDIFRVPDVFIGYFTAIKSIAFDIVILQLFTSLFLTGHLDMVASERAEKPHGLAYFSILSSRAFQSWVPPVF